MILFSIALAVPQYCDPSSRTELGKKKVEIADLDESSSRAAGVMLDIKGEAACGVGAKSTRLERTGKEFRVVELEPIPWESTPYPGDLVGKWMPAERARIDEAWSTLSKRERKILRQVRFEREKEPREPSLRQGALAKSVFPIDGPTIRVWDLAVKTDRAAPTVGSVDRAVYLMVREFGELLARSAAAELSQVLVKGKHPDLWTCRSKAVTTLTREAAFVDMLSVPLSIFGETPAEAFGRAFAIHKLDPTWLGEHHPKVHAFFTEERHLNWRDQEGLEDCGKGLDQVLHDQAISEDAL